MTRHSLIAASAALYLSWLPMAAEARAPCTTITLTRSPASSVLPSVFFGPGGGLASAWVTASTPDCTWTAQSAATWISFPDGVNGTGSRWLRILAAAVSGAGRSATIQVTGVQTHAFSVNQSGSLTGGEGLMQSPAGWTGSPSTSVVAQPFRISGYAIDSRATSGSGVSTVDIYWRDAANTPGGLFLLGQATYGAPHPHVADRLGSEFLNSGYEFEVSALPASAIGPDRSVSVEAYARSTVDGTTLASGATRVTVVPPAVTLTPNSLQFGAALTQSGAVGTITPGQSIALTGFGWTSAWQITKSDPWIQVSAMNGTGPATLTVSIDPSLLPAATPQRSGTVRVSVPDVPGAHIEVPVHVDLRSSLATAPPYGAFDPPASPAFGAVPLGGWALDDVGVANVAIYRHPTAGENPSSLVFIGDATFVDGARPDVAALNPDAPQKTRAGWGYMLLSNVLPGNGNGTFTFYAYAIDVEGKQTLLGSRDITLTNATADIPLGALDAPAPGEVVSGTRTMGGWAVTATPSQIVGVFFYLDGQILGRARYGLARPDVAALFSGPGAPADANAAGFRFTIDTRGLANGLHTIAVLALSTNGDIAGLGSRFFTVKNP